MTQKTQKLESETSQMLDTFFEAVKSHSFETPLNVLDPSSHAEVLIYIEHMQDQKAVFQFMLSKARYRFEQLETPPQGLKDKFNAAQRQSEQISYKIMQQQNVLRKAWR